MLRIRHVVAAVDMQRVCLALFLALCLRGESRPQTSETAVFRDETMCGPKCLWLVAHLFGKEVSLLDLATMAHADPYRGTSVANMVGALKQLGLTAEVVKGDLDAVSGDRRLAILLLPHESHYVLLERADSTTVYFVSNATRRSLSKEEFGKRWDGLAILVGRPSNRGHVEEVSLLGGALLCMILLAYGYRTFAAYSKKSA